MNLPRKTIIPITDLSQLPEPFCAYWEDRAPTRKHLARDYAFYLVDGELYIRDEDEESEDCLLRHWTATNCCGILLYMRHLGLPQYQAFPYVRANGEYLFECRATSDYETSAISPVDGKAFVVHDG